MSGYSLPKTKRTQLGHRVDGPGAIVTGGSTAVILPPAGGAPVLATRCGFPLPEGMQPGDFIVTQMQLAFQGFDHGGMIGLGYLHPVSLLGRCSSDAAMATIHRNHWAFVFPTLFV